jgi:hypothetical protein
MISNEEKKLEDIDHKLSKINYKMKFKIQCINQNYIKELIISYYNYNKDYDNNNNNNNKLMKLIMEFFGFFNNYDLIEVKFLFIFNIL